MTNIEIVTLVGIGLTFIVGSINLYINFNNSKKTTFINSVTASRIKYIQELRESISRFCALASSYSNRISKLSYEQYWELHKESDSLKYLIRLYLNPMDDYWDNQIILLTNEVMLKSDKDPSETIERLIELTQFLLKLEWEGAKKESEVGILTYKQKKEIYDKYVALHKSIITSKNLGKNKIN